MGSKAVPIHLEGEVRPRELGVELLRKLRCPRPQPRAHPLALGLTDFVEPAVLNRRQYGEQGQ
jgi:hypothetical protein